MRFDLPTHLRLRQGMPTVDLVVDAAPAAAWEVLTDLDAWPEWGPTVVGATLDGPGSLALGARGTVRTAVGIALPFEISEFVDGRSWAWRVGGVSATRHEVFPHDHGCVVSFGVPLWAPAYLGVMAIALGRVARMSARRDA
ncbi:SRPBCC family protein [Gordonia soli]|uniref:Polyketide cyclase/dehydrase n=1 Tax=Gordonia soli NBRC 108243 TaxID=1223545 RepID=M0QMR6_9ACTN|nr:SRPBCC family protein [Gordonia soli]GAC69940.1 hypothetical protein GS4_30_00110 [Gordonia soli NBRC 108243]